MAESQEKTNYPPNISEMKPVTNEAYGGGLYGHDDAGTQAKKTDPPASVTQSADGPAEASLLQQQQPSKQHPPPPSTGDRDLDITGQSYIQ